MRGLRTRVHSSRLSVDISEVIGQSTWADRRIRRKSKPSLDLAVRAERQDLRLFCVWNLFSAGNASGKMLS